MVRMPVSNAAKHREETFFHRDFNDYMQEIADEYGAQYLNYAEEGQPV